MRFLSILFMSLLVIQCAGPESSNLSPLNLLSFGIPITIQAPDSAKVQTMDLIVQRDVSIKGSDNFYVQIFASDASTMDESVLKAQLLTRAKQLPYFSKVVSEDASGFIFENKIDSTTTSYDFRRVKIKGDKEYRFQTGLIGTFSQAEAEMMYEATKQ